MERSGWLEDAATRRGFESTPADRLETRHVARRTSSNLVWKFAFRLLGILLSLVVSTFVSSQPIYAQEATADKPTASSDATPSKDAPASKDASATDADLKAGSKADSKPAENAKPKKAPSVEAVAGANSKLVRLSPTDEVWVDAKKKRVIVGGTVCLREGVLEMFACPKGTKEHESVVAVNAKAYQIHTALLAIGARAGHPVRYEPQYESASGSVIHVEVVWEDEKGKLIRRPAQAMVRDVKSGKTMTTDWVFAGSGFWEDAESGEKYYQAEGGELICLSNFSTAMIDLPIESSRDNASLLYEANTDQIPARGTLVRLVLTVGDFREQ